MRRYKSIIDALIINLKFSNQLFADQIYFFDHKGRGSDENDDRLRITDSLSSYLYIEPLPIDDIINRSQVVLTNLLLSKRFVLVSDCVDCDRDILLEFCLQNLMSTPGCKPVGMSTDSERIYFDQTGEEPRSESNLIRITFDITTPKTISKTKVCLELCSNPPC